MTPGLLEFAIVLPFIGTITMAGIILTVIIFFVGLLMGFGTKHTIKYIAVFLAFIFSLYLFGVFGQDLLTKIGDLLDFLMPFVSSFNGTSGSLSTFPTQLVALIAGFVLGLYKG